MIENIAETEGASAERAVVVFAKPPEPGAVKTRLVGEVTEETAAELYARFLEDTAHLVAGFDASVSPVLAYTGPSDHEAFGTYRELGFGFTDQGGGNLGDRLRRVTDRCFRAGADQVAVLGSDSPTLRPRHLRDGFAALDDHDVAVGPSFDGGYYALFLDGPHTSVYRAVDWSTPVVLEQTVARCRQKELLCDLLEFWYDIDNFDDLCRLRFHLLDYFEARDQQVAPATAEYVRRLAQQGLFEADAR